MTLHLITFDYFLIGRQEMVRIQTREPFKNEAQNELSLSRQRKGAKQQNVIFHIQALKLFTEKKIFRFPL